MFCIFCFWKEKHEKEKKNDASTYKLWILHTAADNKIQFEQKKKKNK